MQKINQHHLPVGKIHVHLATTVSQDSHTFNDKKIQDFSKTLKTFFQDLLGARQRLNIKTNSSYLLYIIIVFK